MRFLWVITQRFRFEKMSKRSSAASQKPKFQGNFNFQKRKKKPWNNQNHLCACHMSLFSCSPPAAFAYGSFLSQIRHPRTDPKQKKCSSTQTQGEIAEEQPRPLTIIWCTARMSYQNALSDTWKAVCAVRNQALCYNFLMSCPCTPAQACNTGLL